jgi:hypothetical protein
MVMIQLPSWLFPVKTQAANQKDVASATLLTIGMFHFRIFPIIHVKQEQSKQTFFSSNDKR